MDEDVKQTERQILLTVQRQASNDNDNFNIHWYCKKWMNLKMRDDTDNALVYCLRATTMAVIEAVFAGNNNDSSSVVAVSN